MSHVRRVTGNILSDFTKLFTLIFVLNFKINYNDISLNNLLLKISVYAIIETIYHVLE